MVLAFICLITLPSSLAQNKNQATAPAICSFQAEKRISQFLLTDQQAKVNPVINIGEQLRSANGIPIFKLDGTPALKKSPSSTQYKKGGTGGINTLGHNNEVTIQRVDPTTGKPYLILTDIATYKIISTRKRTD